MKYNKVVRGQFYERPNRFIAKVWIEDKDVVAGAQVNEVPKDLQQRGKQLVTVHVKNTGRCRELLLPEATVILEVANHPNRKTKYDLIAVYKDSLGLVNMDSQAPNKVAMEWLQTQGYSYVKAEYTYGDSRIDFYMEKVSEDGRVDRYLMEVKGCTLEINGVGYFPDAPTTRGVKHLRELTKAAGEGFHCMVAFVIQMEGITRVLPHVETHPEFGQALEESRSRGVEVIGLGCRVKEDELCFDSVYFL